MGKLSLKDISMNLKTPIISFKEMLVVGDAEINSDGRIRVFSNGGVKTQSFRNNSGKVDTYVKCRTKKPLTIRVGYEKSNGESTFEGIHTFTVSPKEDGTAVLEKSFDPSGMAVYYDARSFFVQIDCEEENEFEILEDMIWEHSDFEKLSFYADNLEKMILKLEERLEQITLMANHNIENMVVSPNGSRFIVNVDDEGNLSATSTVPNKVLFVGNSLLLGMGNSYGMCSSSPQNDYYYYVTEAIKAKNPNASFSKLHGACFEQLENPEGFEELWNVRENHYTHRTMCESFTDDLDLIILQLGTNVNCKERAETLAQTIDLFLSRIKQNSPRARIIWVHGWDHESISGKIIADACHRWRIGHLCIKDLNCKENQGILKQTYVRTNGEIGVVDEYWIGHPGDLGMKKIGARIIDFLKL